MDTFKKIKKYNDMSVIGNVLLAVNLLYYIVLNVVNYIFLSFIDYSDLFFGWLQMISNFIFPVVTLALIGMKYLSFCKIRNTKLLFSSVILASFSVLFFAFGILDVMEYNYNDFFYPTSYFARDIVKGIDAAQFDWEILLIIIECLIMIVANLTCYMSIGFIVYNKKILKRTNKTNIAEKYEQFSKVPFIALAVFVVVFVTCLILAIFIV